MKPDKAIVEKYGDCLCEDCKEKIQEETRKLNKFSLLKPRKSATKMMKVLCQPCLNRMVNRMMGGN